MSEVVIYQSKSGEVELNINLSDDTVWLTQSQLSDLFNKNKRTVSEHIGNIFDERELDKNAVVRNFRTTASDGKSYHVKHYNLDVIISVGYRVKSIEGVRFRQWATSVLKQHLIKGYSVHEKRLAEVGTKEINQTLELLQKTLTQNELVTEIGKETIGLIINYSKTWKTLLAYDEESLTIPNSSSKDSIGLGYPLVLEAIHSLKTDLAARGEASDLFGQEREEGLKSILGNLEQTFDGINLYNSTEEKAANLFYLVIKNHPFSDGNKRIGCLVFLLYLKQQQKVLRLNDNGLIALALLVAESDPIQKDLIVKLVVNLLID